MKKLTCEMCGSTDLIKSDGVFVCQSCGTKYSVEEAKKMMIEGTVEVTGTVKVDNTAAIENYLDMARNAKDAGNNKEADSYCNRIIEMDVSNWEAWFIKGQAVGWQSTLSNNRVSETVNAFSKALEFCPEMDKSEVAEKCREELEHLNTALLSLRVGNFKTHPGEKDLAGLRSDVQSILSTTVNFLMKSKILVDTGNIQYGRVINNGLCDAWGIVYKDYKGDDGHPSDFDFRRLLAEGDTLIEGFNLALILLGTTYDDKAKNDLIVQIYKNMINIEETIRDACSYEVNFSYGIKSYNKHLFLTSDAKTARNTMISQWRDKINDVQTAGKKKAEEAAKKRRDDYWAAHEDEKCKLEEKKRELEKEKKDLMDQIAELEKEKASVSAKAKLETILKRIDDLSSRKNALGLLKGKEKKALQEQIEAAEHDADQVRQMIRSQEVEIEKQISPIRSKLAMTNERIGAIDNKLTQDR